MRSKNWFVAAGALLLAAAVPSPAHAGIEPVPWHLLVSNRSDAVAPQPMKDLVVYFVVHDVITDTGGGGTRVIEYPLRDEAGNDLVVLPGESFWVDIELTPGLSYVGWGFTAKMGVDPVPWRVYAMEGPAADEPASAPVLPASLFSPGYGLYAFASPGTLVGAVTLVGNPIYDPCKPVDPWKNHGQYVRCVVLAAGDLAAAGDVTEDEADAIVSAAARSAVGK